MDLILAAVAVALVLMLRRVRARPQPLLRPRPCDERAIVTSMQRTCIGGRRTIAQDLALHDINKSFEA